MYHWKARVAVVGLVAAAVVFAAPRESKAIFHWLCPSNWCAPPPTYGVGRAAYSAAPGCCTPAPQTSYLPTPACTTCYSGYAVTTYRPFLSWLTGRPRYSVSLRPVPYTSCRSAYSPCCPTTSYLPSAVCNPCGGVGSVCGPAGCSPLVPSYGAGEYAPMTTPSPDYYESAPSTSSGSETPRTFKGGSDDDVESLSPVPDSNTRSAPTGTPHLLSPLPEVTSRPVVTAAYTREVRRPVQDREVRRPTRNSAEPSRSLDVGGWRAAGK